MEQQKEQQILQAIHQRRLENLAFFKKYDPALFDLLSKAEFKTYNIKFDPESNEVDLLLAQQSLYGGHAKLYAKQEVERFCYEYGAERRIFTVPTYNKNNYRVDRFFFKKWQHTIEYDTFDNQEFHSYRIGTSYPMIVFMGVGLGFHIEHFLNTQNVQHIIVAETSIEKLFASILCINWSDLYSKYDAIAGKSFTFVIADNSQENLYANLWNTLIKKVPTFPATALFFNHLADAKNNEVVDCIAQNRIRFQFGWGNYDDNINQIHNVMHNLINGVPSLPAYISPLQSNVIVVGAGPSLDSHIDELLELQKNATIISCGTALGVLYKHGLKPDIHVEIESNHDTTNVLSHIDPSWLRNIKFVGTGQVNPFVFELFTEKCLMYNDGTIIAELFSDIGAVVKGAAPTVVNGGVALAAYYKPSAIYLFGVDFGFRTTSNHHAKGTFYDDDSIAQNFKNDVDYDKKGEWYTESVEGSHIRTDLQMYNGLMALNLLLNNPEFSNIAFYNCSHGLKIIGAEWLDSPEKYFNLINTDKKISTKLDNSDNQCLQSLSDLIFEGSTDSRCYDKATLNQILLNCTHSLSLFTAQLKLEIYPSNVTLSEIDLFCSRINDKIHEAHNSNLKFGVQLIRGSLFHFIFALHTYSHAQNDDSDLQPYFSDWQKQFYEFLNEVESHFKSVVFKDYDIKTDSRLLREIHESEW